MKHSFPSNFGAITSAVNKDSASARTRIQQGMKWICDNGAFSGKFDEGKFFSFLEKMAPYRNECIFVVAPDVVGNAEQTINLFSQYAERIKAIGYPVAFVAQDGQENLPFPTEFDVLFIGGSTEWKLGGGAVVCIKRAQELGKWVHVGRVNTRRRIHYFALLAVDSVDGTAIVFKPDIRRKEIIKWMKEAESPLFFV